MTKSTNKESKVSKVPARKLDTSVHSATAKNNIPGASNMKRNQISQPGNLIMVFLLSGRV